MSSQEAEVLDLFKQAVGELVDSTDLEKYSLDQIYTSFLYFDKETEEFTSIRLLGTEEFYRKSKESFDPSKKHSWTLAREALKKGTSTKKNVLTSSLPSQVKDAFQANGINYVISAPIFFEQSPIGVINFFYEDVSNNDKYIFNADLISLSISKTISNIYIQKKLEDLIHIFGHEIHSLLNDSYFKIEAMNQIINSTDGLDQNKAHLKKNLNYLALNNANTRLLLKNIGLSETWETAGIKISKLDTCELSDFIEDILERYEFTGVKISSRHYDKDTKVKGDENLLERVIVNIINNAVKFSRDSTKNPKVSITTRKTNSYIKVIITDNGPGIPDNEIQTVFNKGIRLNRKIKGKGLGLYLTKIIIELHRGEISIRNRSRGTGLTVTIKLPTC